VGIGKTEAQARMISGLAILLVTAVTAIVGFGVLLFIWQWATKDED
jgi:hypothetical protein